MIKNQDFKRNLHIDELIKDAIDKNEGVIGLNGALMVDTGEFSGRIPNDKFIVDEDSSNEDIWWGEVNQRLSEKNFDYLLKKVKFFLQEEIFIKASHINFLKLN